MAKCFLTGIDIPMEEAYLLDQGTTRHALRNLKVRVATLERLLAQLTPKDVVEVFDVRTRKTSVKPQRRLVCQSVATALAASYPEEPLFITWPQFQAKSISAQPKAQPAAKPIYPAPPTPSSANAAQPSKSAAQQSSPKKKRKKKKSKPPSPAVKTEKAKGDCHGGAQ